MTINFQEESVSEEQKKLAKQYFYKMKEFSERIIGIYEESKKKPPEDAKPEQLRFMAMQTGSHLNALEDRVKEFEHQIKLKPAILNSYLAVYAMFPTVDEITGAISLFRTSRKDRAYEEATEILDTLQSHDEFVLSEL